MSPNGLPAKILFLTLNGKINLLYDNRIIFEYIDVLRRKEFDFSKETVDFFIDYVESEGEFISAEPQKIKFIDETDKKFYEVCKTGGAEYLVTGNIRHYPKEKCIIPPREFIEKNYE
jgi:predicted nucleic acid-binding protein